jgi:TolC family type I secretion outer membrane protein
MRTIPQPVPPVPHPETLARLAPAALLLGLALSTPAMSAEDPFRTSGMRPERASSFWEGQGGPSPCPDPATPPSPLRLVDAIDLALCHNPRTRQSWAGAKVSAAQVGVARSAFLPTLDATGNAQRNETRNVPSTTLNAGGRNLVGMGVTFNYLLFDFGGRDASLEQARQALLAADWTHNGSLQSVILDAIQSYYQLHATREAVQSAQTAEQTSLQSLEAARARLKAGSATRADVLQSQTAYSQAQLTRTQAEGDAANSKGLLANVLGIPVQQEIAIVPPPDLEAQRALEQSVASLLDVARERRPELAAAEAQVKAAESGVRVQEAAGKPKLSAFANANAQETAPGNDPRTGAIGLQLSIPLFTGYRTTYQIVAAREQLDLERANRDRLRNDVALEVWRAYQDLRTQGQALQAATDLVTSAQETYSVALGRYKAGVGTVLDLLSAQTALANANVQRITARFRWNVAKVALARAIGVLDPTLVAAQEAALTAPARP